jgi:oligopeptidase B
VIHDPGALDPVVRRHLEAENAYANAILAVTVPLQQTLIAEMRGRIKEDDAAVPAPDGPFAYFSRYCEGGQHPSICREPRGGGACELLLDGDALAADKAFIRLGQTIHSPDHALLAWSADEDGSELFAVRIRDLASMADLPDIVPRTTGEVVWVQDGAAFYYDRLDAQHRPASVHRHRLGTDVSEDVSVYSAPNGNDLFVSLRRSRSGRFAIILASTHDTAETWLVDLHDPDAKATLVAPCEPGLLYGVAHHPNFGGEPALLIRTNASGAEDFKIIRTPLASSSREHWRDVVPHRPGVFIEDFTVPQDWLVRLEREEGLSRIVFRRIGGDGEQAIAFEEEAYWLDLREGFEFATDTLLFSYSSMTTPDEVWEYDLATGARTLRKRSEIPSGHDPGDYVIRRVMAPAVDGDTIPVSLFYSKSTPIDGTAPLFVLGYGAYGIALLTRFDSEILSLVDRGFVYAIAHVRGGTEKGWRWYREGKLAHKPNSFSDFIAATEYLVKTGVGASGKVVAHGFSAGGLLIAAAANRRPDLYAALIAEVPFVDALNTILDDTLPLTPYEWAEWGNPITDAAAFEHHPLLFALRQRAAAALPGRAGAGEHLGFARHLLGARQVGGAAARLQHRAQANHVAHQF